MSFAPSVSPSYLSFGSLHSAAAARRSRDVNFNDERFPPAVNSAFRRLFMILKENNDDNQWQQVEIPEGQSYNTLRDGVSSIQFSLEHKLLPGVCSYSVRASLIVPEVHAQNVLSLLRSTNEDRAKWDVLFDSGHTLESIDDRINILYLKHKPLCDRILLPRDCVVMEAVRPARDGSFFMVQVSTQYESAPRGTGCTRLNVPVHGWVVKKMGQHSEIKFACELSPDQYIPGFCRERWITETALAPLRLYLESLKIPVEVELED
ncbi:hypothetical protein P9112_007915 [Eukaryota sp. TZLM1-RC]